MINYKWLIGLILFSSTVSAQQYNLSNNQYPHVTHHGRNQEIPIPVRGMGKLH